MCGAWVGCTSTPNGRGCCGLGSRTLTASGQRGDDGEPGCRMGCHEEAVLGRGGPVAWAGVRSR